MLHDDLHAHIYFHIVRIQRAMYHLPRRTDWSARYRVARAALNLTLTGQRALLRHTNQQLLPVSASRNVRKLLYILFNLESTGAVTGTALSCVLPSTLSPLSDSCCPPLVRKDTLDSNCTCVELMANHCVLDRKTESSYFIRLGSAS